MEEATTAEDTAKGRTTGVIRCLNCYVRVSPPGGSETFVCGNCGYAWRLSWLEPDLPRIRGPVWEANKGR